MTSAFLASEQTLSEIDSPVRIAAELDPRSRILDEWTQLREYYGQVTADYLRLSSAATAPDPQNHPRPRLDEVTRCTDALGAVNTQMGEFGRVHATELDRARHTATELRVLDQRARESATQAARSLETAPPHLLGLRVVTTAADSLQSAIAAFERAQSIRDRRAAGTALVTAGERVQAALMDAPGFSERATRVIRSVDTRRSAIRTRSEKIPDLLSALRREFSAECSTDLQDSDVVIRTHLEAADAHLADARTHLTSAPDQSITDAEAARDDLDSAEGAVDAVGDRLTLLREVRSDPTAVERQVRFRLRDAQHFAVDKSLVDEWGSVLDAQADRISRARGALERVHPDYWSYLTQLRAVEQRVAEIVDRMRGQVAAR
ncbi:MULTISPECIES: hypothetical protein [unclassified Gordonia (in: high G+C Gram-positive bacteria)]|jgi:hypothetical protein